MNGPMFDYGEHAIYYRLRNREAGRAPAVPSHARRSKVNSRRKAKSPAQLSGIHRRRLKRIVW